jgi:hypothetical protein
MQINANKSKKNQGNPSKKAWISLDSFGRIGPFQWVTANPNKKIFSLFRALRERPVWARASVPVRGNRYSTDAGYLKEIAPKIQLPTAAPSRPFGKDSVTRPPARHALHNAGSCVMRRGAVGSRRQLQIGDS